MNYKILYCEDCKNLVSVFDNEDPTFVCPICGLLNDRHRSKKYFGTMNITSPEIKCEMRFDEFDEGTMEVEEMDDEVKQALELLRQNGWVIKFIGTAKKS
jgi:RNA polymerase subunit RPABC4/transcription elongation factor Spt4